MSNGQHKDILLEKADRLAHLIYFITRTFPKSELFGLTSQLRRAALSVVLNIVEGYARNSRRDHKRFLEISYASLKETKYLIYFSIKENFIDSKDCAELISLTEELGRLLWSKIRTLSSEVQ